MRFVFIVPLAASITCASARAEKLDLSANVRVRYEWIENQPRTGFGEDADLLNIRTILAAAYEGDDWRARAELYDSRTYFGDRGTPVTTNEVNTLELVQAWIAKDFRDVVGPGSSASIQAGRFTLNLGSRRLVAADDYRNTTNGYTGLRGDLATGSGMKATAIYVLPQVRLPDDAAAIQDNKARWDRENFDLVLWGGLVSKANLVPSVMLEASFFHLGERDAAGSPSRDRSLDTISLRTLREPASTQWDFELEVIRQWGRSSTTLAATAPRRAVSAWFVHADTGYTFRGNWKSRFSVELDYASGDRGSGKINRFDTLFGMRRADLAPAGLYNSVGRANIITPGVRYEAAPSRRFDVFAAYRLMWLASRTDSFSTTGVRDATGRSGRFAGQQFDVRVRWWVIPGKTQFEVNGLLLKKGRFLKTAPNAPAGGDDTRYVSLNLTTFF